MSTSRADSFVTLKKEIYVGSILPMIPYQDNLKKIKCSILNFIWDKRDDKTRYNNLQN